jgi:integrase
MPPPTNKVSTMSQRRRAYMRREDYGTHSLRRTKASIIYKATGNLRAVQILLGHTKIESTVRYLGVDVEDALMLAEHTEV